MVLVPPLRRGSCYRHPPPPFIFFMRCTQRTTLWPLITPAASSLTSKMLSPHRSPAMAVAGQGSSSTVPFPMPNALPDLALRKARPPRGRPPVQLLSHFPGLGMLSSAGSWVPLQPALHGNIHQHHPPRISESFHQSCTEQN